MYYSNHFEEVRGDVRKTIIKELMIDIAICTDSPKIADKFNECIL